MILVLFTASYPCGAAAEQAFLKEETLHLSSAFEKVVIVPRHCKGSVSALPANVTVVEEYARFLGNPIKPFLIPQILTSDIFYDDLSTRLRTLLHPLAFFRLIVFLAGAYLTRTWLSRWIERQALNVRDCVFYTYWFDQAAMGIGLAKRIYPDIKLVSRTHGYDLYEERYSPPYWPGRRKALEAVDLLLPDSEAGLIYLHNRHPDHRSKFDLARLGVTEPGFISHPSTDGVIRLTSCSIITPVKRVDLLLEGVAAAARQRPEQQIEWHHFGNGETRLQLQARADAELPANAHAFFPGYSTNQDLMDFYRDQPVDLFLNVSKSEGTPVSIMEVISCGIPVAATAVGGNREIVTEQNGIQISPNPSPVEIAAAIFYVKDNPETMAHKREGSRSLWSESYSADKNFERFVQQLKTLRADGLKGSFDA
ncbi:MAG: glycosyltransferase [Anaerolineales bacterium]